MDFRHQIVTCLFSMLRLSFETQKVKENYAIFFKNVRFFLTIGPVAFSWVINTFFFYCKTQIIRLKNNIM